MSDQTAAQAHAQNVVQVASQNVPSEFQRAKFLVKSLSTPQSVNSLLVHVANQVLDGKMSSGMMAAFSMLCRVVLEANRDAREIKREEHENRSEAHKTKIGPTPARVLDAQFRQVG